MEVQVMESSLIKFDSYYKFIIELCIENGNFFIILLI